MSKYQVLFYSKDDGSEPAKDFILSTDKKMKAKILKTIAMLQENGTDLRMPYSEYLEDGIFEIRAKVGTDISRVLYFFAIEHKIILTNGFIQKMQKTPKREIEKAQKYRNDYLSRKE